MMRRVVAAGAGWLAWAGVLVAVLAVLAAPPASAQLITPGKLSAPHSQLEGIGNCTQCHELRQRGVSDAKCLSCHEVLRARIDRKAGLHATFTDKPCASCHKEHFGVEFAMVKLDTVAFDHAKAGFELKLGHRKPACRDCHKAALVTDTAVRAWATQHRTLTRTFLGLGTGCMDCHAADNVHGEQFGARTCTACHNESTWKKAPLFNHDSSDFVLTGKHRTTACSQCHKTARVPGMAKPVRQFANVTASSCTSCHVDPHKGAMKQTCETCHTTQSWSRLLDRGKFEATFDHSRTRFQLVGAHAAARCAACHNPAARPTGTVRLAFAPAQLQAMYPAPNAKDCLSCHVDVHEAEFANRPNGGACQDCHLQTGWHPTTYDLARHNRESYVLTGSHVAIPCLGCHTPARPAAPPRFRLGARVCVSCHSHDDPHAGQFAGRDCAECHTTVSFRITAFDHARTRYPLDGAHANVACIKCHTRVTPPGGAPFTRYRPLQTTCQACHGAAIPRRP